MDYSPLQNILFPLGLDLKFSDKWINSQSVRLENVDNSVDWSTSPPQSREGKTSLSISHSPKGGATLSSKAKRSLGVDVEEKSRISEKLVLRVCDKTEILESPHFSYLWVVKEAAFKSLYPDNFSSVMGQFHVENWMPIESTLWKFEVTHFERNLRLEGFLFDSGSILIAVTFSVS